MFKTASRKGEAGRPDLGSEKLRVKVETGGGPAVGMKGRPSRKKRRLVRCNAKP